MSRRPALFRRPPCLVSYWQDGTLVFENYATGVRITGDPTTSEILHFFDRWRSADAVIAQLSEYSAASLRAAVTALERHSFLVRSDRSADLRKAESWTSWNPAAGFFHFSTKDVRFARAEVVDRFLRSKARQSPIPSAVKRYPRADSIPLPPVQTRGEFPQALLARRTWRDFSRRPVALADLSTLLGLTWGVQGWLDVPGQRRFPLKTSPSGGARHPLEVYVLARRIQGLARGIYHYSADRHRLERLSRDVGPVTGYLPTQWWFASASAVVFMTAVFPRVQWKYEFPRAYRVVLAEAGHFCQTFCLTATWLGLAPFCTMALADSRIEKDLKIDGITESVLYAAGVGTRPANVKSWPEFTPHRRGGGAVP